MRTSNRPGSFGGCAALLASAGLWACSGAELPQSSGAAKQTVVSAASTSAAATCAAPTCNPVTVPVTPSLELTIAGGSNPDVFANFGIEAVLQQLLTQAGAAGETPDILLRRLFDTYNDSAHAVFTDAFAPHCGDTLNGFPLECPRLGDGDLALAGAVTKEFFPVALFNRFDLAPSDGSNCGEYRIIYWSAPSDTTDRGTINFEAQLPNPQPGCLEACLPVAQFWASLATMTEPEQATALQNFFFTGLPGFGPVISINNYGLNGGGGQIRVNTIDAGSPPPTVPAWQLRENHLALDTGSGAPTLYLQPVPMATNPYGGLFANPTAAFITAFTSGANSPVATLAAATTVPGISMTLSDTFDPGQSTSTFASVPDDYSREALDPTLAAAITAALPAGSTLTPANIVARAESQSCAGCHNLSGNVAPQPALGGGLVWPPAGTPDFGPNFVHVGPRGDLSPALNCTLLPYRQSVLEGFLSGCSNPPEVIPASCPPPPPGK